METDTIFWKHQKVKSCTYSLKGINTLEKIGWWNMYTGIPQSQINGCVPRQQDTQIVCCSLWVNILMVASLRCYKIYPAPFIWFTQQLTKKKTHRFWLHIDCRPTAGVTTATKLAQLNMSTDSHLQNSFVIKRTHIYKSVNKTYIDYGPTATRSGEVIKINAQTL